MKLQLLLISSLVLAWFAQTAQTSTGDTLTSFNAGHLTPTPDRNLIGIEFAEGHYWITGSDPDDSWQHKLYKFNSDGELVEYFEYGLEFAGWSDLAYDGEFLYVADIDTIRQIDMETGQKTGVKIPGPEYYLNGLAYDSASDHFWVSGDGNIIYEVDRQGNVVNAVSFIPDLPAAGLAWDVWSEGGPYLWVWSMKYTPNDVRPQAFQINPATGLLTGLTFEGVIMHPNGSNAADYSLGFALTDELIDDKVVFTSLHGSSYQSANDQLDWVVVYDLDPVSIGIPGPQISINPFTIQNDLYPGDSIDVPIIIENLSDSYTLDWQLSLEYPWSDTAASLGDTLQTFNASVLTVDTNTRMRGIAFLNDAIYISTGKTFNSQFYLYSINKNGTQLNNTDTLYTAFSGWTTITSDEQYIYGSQQYSIDVYDPATQSLVQSIPRPNFSPDGLAYDPQKEEFYLANSVGAIMKINKQGEELNFYVVPYPIEGLAWDKWSAGGPYLWAYYQDESTSAINAIRLDPASGAETGTAFFGIDLSGDPAEPDIARDIVLTPDWQQDKLVMLALHDSNQDPGDGQDKVIVYDLDVTPAPGWINLMPPSFGETGSNSIDTAFVRLKAIMEDTLMTAQVVIRSNDVQFPVWSIPVNFMMLPDVQTSIENRISATRTLIENVFPNPAASMVTLSLNQTPDALTIRCFDMAGQLIYQAETDVMGKTINLDLSNWSPGVYKVFVLTSDQYESRTIIKR